MEMELNCHYRGKTRNAEKKEKKPTSLIRKRLAPRMC